MPAAARRRPRFDPDLDNPHGEPTDRFLGVPIRASRGAVTAVLVALRSASAAFEPLEIAAMEAIAAHASPYVAAWLLEAEETKVRSDTARCANWSSRLRACAGAAAARSGVDATRDVVSPHSSRS